MCLDCRLVRYAVAQCLAGAADDAFRAGKGVEGVVADFLSFALETSESVPVGIECRRAVIRRAGAFHIGPQGKPHAVEVLYRRVQFPHRLGRGAAVFALACVALGLGGQRHEPAGDLVVLRVEGGGPLKGLECRVWPVSLREGAGEIAPYPRFFGIRVGRQAVAPERLVVPAHLSHQRG